MVKYADLPPYVNRNSLSHAQYQDWIRHIDFLKKTCIIPIIDSGEVNFEVTFHFDFLKVKQSITSDFPSLVKYFLLCTTELKKKEHKMPRLLISFFFGQQRYKEDDTLKKLRDGIDYGHLRRLHDVFYSYEFSKDPYYLSMMNLLCAPYLDVMEKTIYLCKGLFKKSEEGDLASLIADVTDDDYLGGSD